MPACTTDVQGEAQGLFGIAEEEEGMVTQSVKISHKRDKKQLRNYCGSTVSVAFYNRMSEVEIEGYIKGALGFEVGLEMPLNNAATPAIVGKLVVDEISIDLSNEDFKKISVKGSAYEKIT